MNDATKPNLCSQCLKPATGTYSGCCSALVCTPDQIQMAMKGKIPKMGKLKVPKKTKKGGNRDAVSGLRTGTKKHKVWQLYKKGCTVKQVVNKLKVNESSARGWFAQFRKHDAITH